MARNSDVDPWSRLAMPKSTPYPSENVVVNSIGSPNTSSSSTPPKVLSSKTIKKESFLDRVSRDGENQTSFSSPSATKDT